MKSDSIIVILLIILTVTAVATSYYQYHKRDADNVYDRAIYLGGQWFVKNQDAHFLEYEYDYITDSYPRTSQRLREMGALWSITELSNYFDDPEFRMLSRKGLDFFENYFAYKEDEKFYYVNITPSKLKLGYNAFGIMSLINIDYPDKEDYMEGLAQGILYSQLPHGELDTFFWNDRQTGKDYYPGEALLSLMYLYEETGKREYLETVAKAFPHYRSYFDTHPNTAFVPWQSRAYTKFYMETKEPIIAEFIFDMNDFMVQQHNGQDCKNFYFRYGTTEAVYMEGVIQAYIVAEDLGDTERAECYKNYVRQGAEYIMKLQVTNSTNPRAQGGFLGSDGIMRVDRNQHAVLTLMDARNAGII